MFDLDSAVRAWRQGFIREQAFSTFDLDELEDHLRAAYEVEVHLNPGLTPARAFAYACENLGAAADLSDEFAKVEGKAWRRIVRAGWATWALAFFLPVAQYGNTFRDALHGDLPGLEALWLALTGTGGVIGILSALTNAVMLVSCWRLSDAGRTRVWLSAALMAVATVLNLWWLVGFDDPSTLFAGYYTWLASFGIVATGLALRARSLPEEPSPETLVTAR